MNPYAFLSADLSTVIEVKMVDPVTIETLRAQNNPKAIRIRDFVDAQKPTPNSSQVVVQSGWTIDATTATRTWGLRDKTAEELAEDSRIAARDALITSTLQEGQQALNNWANLSPAQLKTVQRRMLEVQMAQLRNELSHEA